MSSLNQLDRARICRKADSAFRQHFFCEAQSQNSSKRAETTKNPKASLPYLPTKKQGRMSSPRLQSKDNHRTFIIKVAYTKIWVHSASDQIFHSFYHLCHCKIFQNSFANSNNFTNPGHIWEYQPECWTTSRNTASDVASQRFSFPKNPQSSIIIFTTGFCQEEGLLTSGCSTSAPHYEEQVWCAEDASWPIN